MSSFLCAAEDEIRRWPQKPTPGIIDMGIIANSQGQMTFAGLLEPPVKAEDKAPLSRRSDPVTSFQAAEKLRRSGRLKGQRKVVLRDLSQNDGSTSAEISARVGDDRYLASRRMCELERAGLVVRGRPRVCRSCGSVCLTWWLVK